jgi:uncharacterized phage-associated protein
VYEGSLPVSLLSTAGRRPYSRIMAASAHDIAAVLREQLPGIGVKKLHKMLYYCQGFHLATFGVPLFTESISAWDMGPVVSKLWKAEKDHDEPPPRAELGEAELNTIGYVISRYGRLSGRDLESLTHSEDPWRNADLHRQPGESVRIETGWIRDYFAAVGYATGDDDEGQVDSAAVAAWLRDAESRKSTTSEPDDLAGLVNRLSGRG